MDCAQIYDAFTPLVIMGLEDYGFCKRGEGGPFTEGGRIELGGELPVLTSGGGLSEAYVHGFNLIIEARAPDPRHVVQPGAGLQGDAGHRRVGRGDQRDGAAGESDDGDRWPVTDVLTVRHDVAIRVRLALTCDTGAPVTRSPVTGHASDA